MKNSSLVNILSEIIKESKFGKGYIVYDPSTYKIQNVFDGYGRELTRFLDSNKSFKVVNSSSSKIPGNLEILKKIDAKNGTEYTSEPVKPSVGQDCTLSIPYGKTVLQFKGALVSVGGNIAKVKYKTGGREITTDAPIEWIS